METWPEFVTEGEASAWAPAPEASNLTGWETVIFEVEDAQGSDLGSVFSTAAMAP